MGHKPRKIKITADAYETVYMRTTKGGVKKDMINRLRPILSSTGAFQLGDERPRHSSPLRWRHHTTGPSGAQTAREPRARPPPPRTAQEGGPALAVQTLERMLETDRSVQRMQRRWIAKVNEEQSALQRILSLVIETTGQMNTMRNQPSGVFSARRAMANKAQRMQATLLEASDGRAEVLVAAQSQQESVLQSIYGLLEVLDAGEAPEGEAFAATLREAQVQLRALHGCNTKIIQAAQSQVRAIHDEYQVFEKEFHATVGDSLTRLASPRGALDAERDTDLYWERADESDMESNSEEALDGLYGGGSEEGGPASGPS